MAWILWKEGERVLQIAWVNFKELLLMAKQSTLALYATVMTVLTGTFLLGGFVACYLWVTEVRQGQKDRKAHDELHIKDMEAMLGWADSAKMGQYKHNAYMETHPLIIMHDTVYITKKQ